MRKTSKQAPELGTSDPLGPCHLREQVRRARDEGDVVAWEWVRYLTEDDVTRRVRRSKVPPGDLESVVEEVFRKANRSLARFDVDRDLRSWLLGIADRAIPDYYRRHPSTTSLEAEADVPGGAALTDEWNVESTYQTLRDAMSRMPNARRRRALWLLYFADEDYRGVMKDMDLDSVESARQLKYNALRELGVVLRKMGHGAELLRPLVNR
jgi:RNA polymerase sigma factor (sigma-70 family)